MEGQGKAVEGQGKAVEGQGKAVEGQGKAVEGQRKAVEGQGKAVEGQRKAVEGQGKAVEGQRKAVEVQGKAVPFALVPRVVDQRDLGRHVRADRFVELLRGRVLHRVKLFLLVGVAPCEGGRRGAHVDHDDLMDLRHHLELRLLQRTKKSTA